MAIANRYLTADDVQNYGSDLVDFAQRAAADALAPTLQQLQQQNAETRQQLAREARKRLDAEVAAAVPDFRSVDADSRWHQWLLTIDPMLGRPRQAFLSEAIQAADAPRVISFFRQFQREVGHSQNVNDSTGRLPPGQRRASAPHGQIFTRAQVRDLYAAHFRGAYKDREAEWARTEASIIQASADGRIVGGVDVAGK